MEIDNRDIGCYNESAMTTREEQIETGIVEILIKQFNPDKILLFGSRSKGTNTTTADFDIAISGSKPEITIQQKLSAMLEALLGLYKADIIYLDEVEAEFREIILTTGKVLYEKRN